MKKFLYFPLFFLSLRITAFSFDPSLTGHYRDLIPHPVIDNHPEWIELYDKAWELASQKVKIQDGIPQSPYMDEGLWDDTIWIWDTCFMSLFTKYATEAFPGIDSLKNFYVTLHREPDKPKSLTIQHPDNPPLFAWAEYDTFKITGNTNHIRHLLQEDRFLQIHYKWFESVPSGLIYKNGPRLSVPVAKKTYPLGFSWNGVSSGMDNTPRCRYAYSRYLWIDAISQQALSALYISRLLQAVGNKDESKKWETEYNRLKTVINEHYWDEESGCYYDIRKTDGKPSKVITPASFWPLLAEVADSSRAGRMVRLLKDPEILGGEIPIPSVARNNKSFRKEGNYWKGSLWLPTSYMTIKAVEKYGYYDLAAELAVKTVSHMAETYRIYTPHTIWECYSPTQAAPGKNGDGKTDSREDFCGWSALGPISLLIENVLGFYDIDAQKNCVRWYPVENGRTGIENLRFGTVVTDIVKDGNTVTVSSNKEYSLVIREDSFSIQPGTTVLTIDDHPGC